MKLHGYWRSGTSYRTRIALNLKGLAYDYVPVNLLTGAHREDAYAALNPQKLVPALELEDGTILTQSMAIIEYLEEIHPRPALLPVDPVRRAQARAAAQVVACDIHPIQNLRVLKYVKGELGADESAKNAWAAHWIVEGFTVLERLAAARSTAFLFGEAPGYVECTLVPQMYSARRFGVDLDPFPALVAVDEACAALDAFKAAAPEAQPDAQ